MLGTLRTRRRNPYGVHLCAVAAAVLLLFSVSLLYSRLSKNSRGSFQNDGVSIFEDPLTLEFPLLQDSDPDLRSTLSNDRIDELDIIDEDSKVSNEEEILRGLESEGEENENSLISSPSLSSGYYFDQVSHVIRRAFDGQSVDEFDQWEAYVMLSDAGLPSDESRTKVAFGSDDVAVDEELRRKVLKVNSIEDALLLKLDSHGSPLREGWGAWFDAKSTFLRKDKMFRSNLELLNPLNNMLLQDPDGPGVTGLTRGDKLMQKGLINEMKKNKPLGLSST